MCVCVHACVRVHACDGSRKGKSAAKDGRKGKAATKTAKELAQQPKARKPQGHCTGCPWKSNRKTTSAFMKCDDWICRNHTFTLQNMRIQMKHVYNITPYVGSVVLVYFLVKKAITVLFHLHNRSFRWISPLRLYKLLHADIVPLKQNRMHYSDLFAQFFAFLVTYGVHLCVS